MKPVDQLVVGKLGLGDCFRACVASIFEFPIEEMPNYWDQTQDAHEFWMLVNEWTRKRLGVACITVSVAKEHAYIMDDVLCVAQGRQNRSDEEHAVVWKNGLIHDPHPARAGLINEPDTFTFFAPIDPQDTREVGDWFPKRSNR